MSSTLAQIRTRVKNRTLRGTDSDVNFSNLVDDAINNFLVECSTLHTYKEMKTTVSVAFAADEYQNAMGTGSLTGFETAVHSVLSAWCRKTDASERSYPLTFKEEQFFNRMFPDRSRSGAISCKPNVISWISGNVVLSQPCSDAYTVYLYTTHLPSRLSADSDTNPIPLLDNALFYAGVAAVYEVIEPTQAATMANRAEAARLTSIRADTLQPAQQIGGVPSVFGLGPQQLFSLSDLQDIFPDPG